MNKTFKSFIYIVACISVFFALVKIYNNTEPALNSASVFEWKKVVNIYFPNSSMGSNEDCNKVFPVSRPVINAETFGPGALEELLAGPNGADKGNDYFTSINSGVMVQKFEVIDSVAYVDFNSRLNEGVGGSCRVSSIRAQIEKTLSDLPDIDSVVISVDGKTEGILEP